MRMVFCGYGEFGYAVLKTLLEAGRNVAHVYTHPVKPNAKGGETFPDLMALAAEHNVPASTREINDSVRMASEILAMESKLLVSVMWQTPFPQSVLGIPKLGAINVHGSLLPKYRGKDPIVWAMINGDKECGITIHKIDGGLNTGDIIVQKAVPITHEDTIATLTERMIGITGPLVLQALTKLGNPSFKPLKQYNKNATTVEERQPEDGIIDWSWDTARIYNWIRAQTHPLFGAFSPMVAGQLKVWKAKPELQERKIAPNGSIVAISDTAIIVQAGDGLMQIEDATLLFPPAPPVNLHVALQRKLIKSGDLLGSPAINEQPKP